MASQEVQIGRGDNTDVWLARGSIYSPGAYLHGPEQAPSIVILRNSLHLESRDSRAYAWAWLGRHLHPTANYLEELRPDRFQPAHKYQSTWRAALRDKQEHTCPQYATVGAVRVRELHSNKDTFLNHALTMEQTTYCDTTCEYIVSTKHSGMVKKCISLGKHTKKTTYLGNGGDRGIASIWVMCDSTNRKTCCSLSWVRVRMQCISIPCQRG